MYHILLPVAGLLIFDTIAMKYITSYAKNSKKWRSLYLAIAFEIVAWVFLVQMLRSKGLAIANAIWDIGSLVLVTMVAIFVFREHLSPHHLLGIALGIVSISLLLKDGVKGGFIA